MFDTHQQMANSSEGLGIAVMLALDDDAMERTIRSALSLYRELRIQCLSDLPMGEQHEVDPPKVLIISWRILNELYDYDPDIVAALINRVRIMAFLSEADLSDKNCWWAFCHGWILPNQKLDRIAEIIRLADLGYCVVPNSNARNLEAAKIRPAGIDQLSMKECAILAELGRGTDDDIIARRLGISKIAVAMMIHTILEKMHFEFRDEARRFSVDNRVHLQKARRKKLLNQSNGNNSIPYQSALAWITEQIG